MLLLLFRHGIAEDDVTPDEARPLTEIGRRRVIAMARLLRRLSIQPEAVLTSPRVRARQTAEVLVERLRLKREALVTPALDFSGSWEEFVEAIENADRRRDSRPEIVLASGHQPHLGIMATLALEASDHGMELRKASCLGLRFPGAIEPGGARLDFYLTPRLARLADQ